MSKHIKPSGTYVHWGPFPSWPFKTCVLHLRGWYFTVIVSMN